MSDLPDTWSEAPLGDISHVEMGQSPDSRFYNDQGEGLPFFQGKAEFGALYPTVRKWCSEPKKLAEAGDILLSVRAPVGPTNLAVEKCCIGRGLAAIRTRAPIRQKYLLHFFRHIQSWLSEQGTGSTFSAVSGGFVRNLQITLAPLPEQTRIVDKLDAVLARVDACRDRLDRVPGILKRYRQSVLAAATSGKLTEDWREYFPQRVDAQSLADKLHSAHEAAGGHKAGNAAAPTEDVHDLSTDMFPNAWALLTLRDVVLPDRPITYGILKPGPELADGVPYIRVADFPDDKLNLAAIRKTSPKMDEEFKRSRLRPGDLLLSIRGTVGRLVVIPDELSGANITQDSARLSVQPIVNRDYVLWYLRSTMAQDRMKGSTKGVAVRGINIGDVRALQLPLPSRGEQDEIVRRVECLFAYADRLEARYQTARAQVDKLTPALLAKAFRGELVPQDPEDEPAAALLTRIRTARAEAPTRTKTRKGATGFLKTRKAEVIMLNRKNIADTHLTSILKERGPLSAESLWSASQLDIDDFYDQLKDEEARGLLKEVLGNTPTAQRILEVVM